MKKKHIIILFLTAVFCLFFYKIIFYDNIPYTGDFMTMSLPWKYLIYNSVHHHSVFPEYNPYVFSGLPFAANIQAGMFYPIDIIFYFIEPLKAFKITFFVNYFIFLIGCYLLISKFAQNIFIQLFGTICIGFGWAPVYYAPLKQVYNAYVWLPLIFYYLLKFKDTCACKDIIKYSICLSFSILGGHPQFPFYAIFFSGIIIAVNFVYKPYLFKINFFLKLLAGAVIVIILTAPQILTTVKFSKFTSRNQSDSFYFVSDGSVKPAKLINALIPDLFGNIVDRNAWGNFWRPLKQVHTHIEFIGLLPLFFLVFGFSKKMPKNKLFYFFLILSIFTVFIALGKHTPILKFLYDYFPGFSKFRSPKRVLFFYQIFTAIAAVIGFNIFLANEQLKNKNILKNMLTLLFFVFIIFLIAHLAAEDSIINSIKKIGYKKYALKSDHYHNWRYYSNFIDSAAAHSIKQIYIFFCFSFGYIFLLMFANFKRKYIFLLLIFFVFELHWFNFKFFENNSVENVNNNMTFYDKSIITIENKRALPIVPLDHLLALNGPVFFELESVRGYDPLVDKEYIDFMRGIETNLFDVHPNTEISKPDLNSQLLDLLNIEYIYSDLELDSLPQKIIFEKKYKDLFFYRNTTNIGYAKIFNNFIYEKDINQSYELLKNNIIDARKTLILNIHENDNNNNDTQIVNFKNEIVKINKTRDSIEISGKNSGINYLFISEKYNNFDKIIYNGNSVEKIRCNNLFIAVKLEDGLFEIKLTRDTSVLKKLITTAIVFLFILLFLVNHKKIS